MNTLNIKNKSSNILGASSQNNSPSNNTNNTNNTDNTDNTATTAANITSSTSSIKAPRRYVVAKTRNDALMEEGYLSSSEAKEALPLEGTNEKWFCFAKLENDAVDKTVRGFSKYKLTVVAYYDCISPLGKVATKMQWYDLKDYANSETAKSKFKSMKI